MSTTKNVFVQAYDQIDEIFPGDNAWEITPAYGVSIKVNKYDEALVDEDLDISANKLKNMLL
jgi:hypothetical protein